MRIDSSGNLLVGTTDADNSDQGIELRNDGRVFATATSGSSAFNRKTTPGDIVQFAKDAVTVGSIGTAASSMYIGGSGNGAIYFNGVTDIRPWNKSTQANLDNSIDLGDSGARFKDLYLSGGVVFGTTGGSVSSKTLDDYEEGTWTPAFTNIGTGTYGVQLEDIPRLVI